MEPQGNEALKKEGIGNRILKFIGILFFLFTCLAFLGAVALDLTGEKPSAKCRMPPKTVLPAKPAGQAKWNLSPSRAKR